MRHERFDELVNLFLDKEISEAELAELSELARTDEGLKAELVRRYKLHQAMLYSVGQLSEQELESSREASFESIIHHPMNLVSFAAAGSYLFAAAVAVVIVGMALLAPETSELSSDVPSSVPSSGADVDGNLNVFRVLTAQEQLERFRVAENLALEGSRELEEAPIRVEPFVIQAAPFVHSGFQLVGAPVASPERLRGSSESGRSIRSGWSHADQPLLRPTER